METPLNLTLLYTGGIAGDLALLPRLHTFLQRMKSGARHCLLLDLGGACSDAVWHCQDTGGRSTLIVLDGMGYHAANVDRALSADVREKLAAQVTMAPVNKQHHWRYNVVSAMDVVIATEPVARDACLQVMLAPAQSTRLEGRLVRLQAVERGQVGKAVVNLRGEPALVSACIHPVPADTPPNPSIAGAVDFVLSEARYYRRRQS